jgi:hypothetical protein
MDQENGVFLYNEMIELLMEFLSAQNMKMVGSTFQVITLKDRE